METTTIPPVNLDLSAPQLDSLDFISLVNADWLWLVFGFFALLSLIFFITVLYHWLRYETNTLWSSAVIVTNGFVIVVLLGGAGINLSTFLSTFNQAGL